MTKSHLKGVMISLIGHSSAADDQLMILILLTNSKCQISIVIRDNLSPVNIGLEFFIF